MESLSLPCEERVRRWLSASQEDSPHQNLICSCPDLRLPNLQNCEEISFCCLSHSVYDILLWQSELTKREQAKLKLKEATRQSCVYTTTGQLDWAFPQLT